MWYRDPNACPLRSGPSLPPVTGRPAALAGRAVPLGLRPLVGPRDGGGSNRVWSLSGSEKTVAPPSSSETARSGAGRGSCVTSASAGGYTPVAALSSATGGTAGFEGTAGTSRLAGIHSAVCALPANSPMSVSSPGRLVSGGTGTGVRTPAATSRCRSGRRRPQDRQIDSVDALGVPQPVQTIAKQETTGKSSPPSRRGDRHHLSWRSKGIICPRIENDVQVNTMEGDRRWLFSKDFIAPGAGDRRPVSSARPAYTGSETPDILEFVAGTMSLRDLVAARAGVRAS
jgi:hypothetical protein